MNCRRGRVTYEPWAMSLFLGEGILGQSGLSGLSGLSCLFCLPPLGFFTMSHELRAIFLPVPRSLGHFSMSYLLSILDSSPVTLHSSLFLMAVGCLSSVDCEPSTMDGHNSFTLCAMLYALCVFSLSWTLDSGLETRDLKESGIIILTYAKGASRRYDARLGRDKGSQ